MQRPPFDAPPLDRRRAGFTLVEMLVALTIFIILATLTLGAFKGVSKNDQIAAATNQIKGWFEHAKSKAIHDKLPRGVRFLPDASNPNLCSSVVYIGSAGYDEGDFSTTPPSKFVLLSQNGLVLTALGQTATEMYSLVRSGSLSPVTARRHGLRCELPRDSGFWYPITGVAASLTPVPNATITLGRPVTNATGGLNQPLDYRIELGPTVLESDPIALPRGVVIDLDGSMIPAQWRPGWDSTSSSWVQTSNMDVMFSPQGTFTGQIAPSIGVLHLLVSTLEDADAARLNAGGNHPQDLATGPARPLPFTYPFVLANPKTTQKVVSIFTSSGRITTSDVFVYTYSSGVPVLFDAYANNTVNTIRLDTSSAPLLPFRNALVGKEVK